MDIEEAVNKALDEMPEDWLIRKYLISNKSEVMTMCLTEYNEAETMQMFKEEGLEQGIDIGRDLGIKAIVKLCKNFHGSASDAIEQIVANMGLSQSEAESQVAKYW